MDILYSDFSFFKSIKKEKSSNLQRAWHIQSIRKKTEWVRKSFLTRLRFQIWIIFYIQCDFSCHHTELDCKLSQRKPAGYRKQVRFVIPYESHVTVKLIHSDRKWQRRTLAQQGEQNKLSDGTDSWVKMTSSTKVASVFCIRPDSMWTHNQCKSVTQKQFQRPFVVSEIYCNCQKRALNVFFY